MQAVGTDAARVEGVPSETAGAGPCIGFSGRPTAQRAANARTRRLHFFFVTNIGLDNWTNDIHTIIMTVQDLVDDDKAKLGCVNTSLLRGRSRPELGRPACFYHEIARRTVHRVAAPPRLEDQTRVGTLPACTGRRAKRRRWLRETPRRSRKARGADAECAKRGNPVQRAGARPTMLDLRRARTRWFCSRRALEAAGFVPRSE